MPISSLMPLFFLFSGFSLMLAYKPTENESRSSVISNLTFYRNRFARTYPVYVLWTLLSIPPWIFGYGSDPPSRFVSSLITSLTMMVSALFFTFGGPIDFPGWTIQCSQQKARHTLILRNLTKY
mmetsp:Transcript_1833/g.2891  ORF Transcript_1833/g.2891 Transcript_1833/m.2891 type:complete len:124 (+) Transcript_1833:9-380(+)